MGSGPNTQPPPAMQLLLFLPNSEGALMSCCPPLSMVPDSDQRLAGLSFFPIYNCFPEKVAPETDWAGCGVLCHAKTSADTGTPHRHRERVGKAHPTGKWLECVLSTRAGVGYKKGSLASGGLLITADFPQTETDQTLKARTEAWLPRWSQLGLYREFISRGGSGGRKPSGPAGRRVVKRPQSSVGWE